MHRPILSLILAILLPITVSTLAAPPDEKAQASSGAQIAPEPQVEVGAPNKTKPKSKAGESVAKALGQTLTDAVEQATQGKEVRHIEISIRDIIIVGFDDLIDATQNNGEARSNASIATFLSQADSGQELPNATTANASTTVPEAASVTANASETFSRKVEIRKGDVFIVASEIPAPAPAAPAPVAPAAPADNAAPRP
jgi:hypothetical protein